jgi:WD40 repeat protein/DNA-binding SARP family transcriptional activator
MPQLRLELLGRFQVSLGGTSITTFESNKVRALLAYLAVETQHPHSREKLAAILWPDWPDRAALSNLRYALSDLRKVIGDRTADPPFLLISREAIQFNTESDHLLDVAQFIELTSPGDGDGIGSLEQAVSLYQGEFLEGFSVSEAAPFEDWSRLKREQLQRVHLQALHKLAAALEVCGELERALPYARRQIEIDPLDESAHRQLMRLLALSGMGGAALTQYETCRKVLQTELGAEPSQETAQLYQLLLKGELPPTPPSELLRPERVARQVGPCPYRGLAAFREQDTLFFFGREQFSHGLEEAILRGSPIAVIVGSSGSGKSSVVYAGLLPKLRPNGDWQIACFRPGERPFRALAGALLPLLEPDTKETDRLIQAGKLETVLSRGEVLLDGVVARAMQVKDGAKHLLLVVDQFEELYTLCTDPDERQSFLDQLLGAVSLAAGGRDRHIVLLLTLRADFMSQALAYRPFADVLQGATVLMGPMNRDELRSAVEKPAELQGAVFEAGLVDRLLDDVGKEPGNLPLLEFALTLLWENHESGWLTHAVYDSIGLVDGALASYADQVYANLESGEQERARNALLQLVKPGEGTEDTRRVAVKEELGEENWKVIQLLADQRLVVTGLDAAGNETVEVVHEALIQKWGRFKQWIETDRTFRSWQERLRDNQRQWQESGREESALLRGGRLSYANEWLAERSGDLSQAEKEYILASQAEQQAQQEAESARQKREAALTRRSRNFLFALVVILLLAVVGTSGLAYIARQAQVEAEAQSQARATQQALAEGEAAGRGTQQAIAEAERANAQAQAITRATAEADALRQADLARARELSLAAINNLEVDPERSILLALQAVTTAQKTGNPIPIEIQDALHQAVLASRLRLTLRGHTSDVWDVAFSPDGAQLATASWDGTAKIWDAKTGDELATLQDHQKALQDIAYSPDGSKLATADDEGVVIVWNPNTGEQSARSLGHAGGVWKIAFSPDGELLATAGWDKSIRIWDTNTGDEMVALPVGEAAHPYIAFSPDGRRLLSAGESIQLWDTETWDERLAFPGTAGAISPDGTRLAIGGADGSLRLVDAATGEEQITLRGSLSEPIEGIVFSPDGSLLVAHEWQNAEIWDAITGQALFRISESIGIKPVFTQDGSRLITSGQDGIAKVWNVESGEELFTLAGSGAIYNLALSPSCDNQLAWCGARLATASRDQTARVWDISPAGSGELLVLPGFSAQFSPDGVHLTTSEFLNRQTIKFQTRDISPGGLGTVVYSYTASLSAPVTGGVFSPDGNQAALLASDASFTVLDLVQGAQVISFPIDEESQMSFALSPDWTRLATVVSSTVQIWDATSGLKLLELPEYSQGVTAFRFSPDSQYLAVAVGEDYPDIHLLDANTYQEIASWPAHAKWINDLAFNPDGTRLATSSGDMTVKVWQVPSGEELLTLGGHTASTGNIAFSQDGYRLATTSYDGTIRVWDALTGQNLLTLPGNAFMLSFSPDGKYLASGDLWDGLVQVYLLDIDEFAELARSRLTRSLTEEECRQYLHLEQCPAAGN